MAAELDLSVRRRRSAVAVAVTGLTLALAGCSSASGPGGSSVGPTTTAASATTIPSSAVAPSTSASSAPTSSPPAQLACARQRLAGLDDTHRVGQLLTVGLWASSPDADAADATSLAAGGVFLRGHSTQDVATVGRHVAALQAAAKRAGTLPLLVAVDQEGGQIRTLTGPGFPALPSGVAQGRWPSATLAREQARSAKALQAAGIRLNFAPVADVVDLPDPDANAPVGHYERQFGSAPAPVAQAVVTAVRAQTSARVLSTVKHFPGLGRVLENTDTSAAAVDATTDAGDATLEPFRAAMAAGVGAVMVSSGRYPRLDADAPAVFSSAIITGLLRGQLGWQGLVVADDLGKAVSVASVPPGERAVRFVEAGGDVVLAVEAAAAPAMAAALLARYRQDPAFRAKVDASVTRVLAAKVRAGLVSC